MTLLEVVIAVGLAGIVAAILLTRFGARASDARKNTCYVLKGNIEMQVQLWYRQKGTWPASNLSDIGADVVYFPDGIGSYPVDGSAYSLDATTRHVLGHTH